MEYYSIGELCSITKGSTGIMKAVPGPYPLVTTGPDRKSSSDYEFDDEAVCIPLVSSTGHGHKSLNYIHYQSGKFALGTILAAVIPKDKSVLSAEYLQRYLFFFKDQLVVSLMKGAANVSLAVKDIAKIQVPVPPISKQKEFIELFNKAEDGKLSLLHENQNQSSYLIQLRQTILQEAIEGKLTADWRKENPVRKGDPDYDSEALLEKIQAEKEKLIKKGKIKMQKPHAPIKAEEVPFELPEGWVWTRLGEISEGFQYGSSAKSLKDGKVPVLRMGNIQDGKIDWNGLVYTNNKNEIEQYVLKKGDLLFNRTNSRELVGKTAVFDGLKDAIFAGYLVRFSPLAMCSSEYFNFIMNSTLHREWCNQNKTDAIGQSNINATKLRDFLFPLAPLAEQQAIVERVEKLLSMVDELEKQVSERKEQSEQLMQAVLREAFEGGN